jgi:hypothetical protein
MQENIDSDRRHTPLTCTTRRLFPCRSIPGVSRQVPTVEGTVTAFMHVHAWVVHGAHGMALHRGTRKGCSRRQRGLQRRCRAAASKRPRHGARRSPEPVVMWCRPGPPRTPALLAERTRPARSCRGVTRGIVDLSEERGEGA